MGFIQEEGTFKGYIEDFGIKEIPTGTIYFSVRCRATAKKLDSGWAEAVEGDEPDFASGDLPIVNKEGNPVDIHIKNLRNALGWTGGLIDLKNGSWFGTPVKFKVEGQDGNDGRTYYHISFLNPMMDSSIKSVADDRLAQLEAKFGGKLKALNLKAGPVKAPVQRQNEGVNSNPQLIDADKSTDKILF